MSDQKVLHALLPLVKVLGGWLSLRLVPRVARRAKALFEAGAE